MKTILFNGSQLKLDVDQFNALTRFLRALGYLEEEASADFDQSDKFKKSDIDDLFDDVFETFISK